MYLLYAFMGVMTGIGIGVEARRLFENRDYKIGDKRFLVARYDLAEGHTVTAMDFTLKNERDFAMLPDRGFTDQDLHFIEGRALAVAVRKGEVLKELAFEARGHTKRAHQIAKGHRAYWLPTDNAHQWAAGDKVDVFFIPRAARALPITLIDGARVLEVDQGGENNSVLIAVKQADIQLLEKAQQSGKLKLVLRPGDEILGSLKSRRELFGSPPRAKIEILSEAED